MNASAKSPRSSRRAARSSALPGLTSKSCIQNSPLLKPPAPDRSRAREVYRETHAPVSGICAATRDRARRFPDQKRIVAISRTRPDSASSAGVSQAKRAFERIPADYPAKRHPAWRTWLFPSKKRHVSCHKLPQLGCSVRQSLCGTRKILYAVQSVTVNFEERAPPRSGRPGSDGTAARRLAPISSFETAHAPSPVPALAPVMESSPLVKRLRRSLTDRMNPDDHLLRIHHGNQQRHRQCDLAVQFHLARDPVGETRRRDRRKARRLQ